MASWLARRLHIPASESQMALILGLCSVMMSLMFGVIVWQSRVIAEQREVIRWLAHGMRMGG